MSTEHVGPAVVGGLIVRNGRHRGTRVPLKLPVTVIGSGESCDIRLQADGIAAMHCVVAVTPMGPTVRSWHAVNTLVNGQPTTAAVLHHGDELTVGPCSFKLAWFGELNAAEPELPSDTTLAVSPGTEWSLHEREQALHEQERQIADLLDGKQRQVEDLLSQLQANREQFLAERGGVSAELAAAKKLRREAEAAKKAADVGRAKHHATYRKLVLRAKKQRQDGEKSNAEVAERLRQASGKLDRDRAEFESARNRTLSELAASKQRIADAWSMLEDGQRRLLHDRQSFDVQVAEERKCLEQYAAELTERDRTMTDTHARLETRCAELQAELRGLDRRATHAQIAVQDLEHQRIIREASAGMANSTAKPASFDLVPLNGRTDRSFDELMADLTKRERELDTELKAVAVQRGDFERLAGELADQRSVLVAQFAKLAAATRLWQQEECGHAMELERLAGELDSRERVVAVREQRLLLAEDQCRQRERDLWAFRVKLEGWQAGLTAHESRWYAERDRVDAECDRERERLAAWEQSLQGICETWQNLRSKERDAMLLEINGWQQDRSDYVAAMADLDAERTAMAKQATLLAARMTATEEAAATVDPKRLRVLQKKWESHFRRLEKHWTARQAATAKLAGGLEAKITMLKNELAKATTKRIEKAAQKQELDRKTLISDRQSAESQIVSIRPRRADRELIELRSEVERISAVLMNAPMPTGEDVMIALASAKAA